MPVVKTPGVLGGSARIEGTRIAVWMIVSLIRSGWTVEQILEEYPGLTREQVEEALAYYEEHRDEVDGEIERADELWEIGKRHSEADLRAREAEEALRRALREAG
ncbi:MAG: hypothetical protein DRO01_07645 [Thermoproteota archaeon]|nr:MAG: hypothetical protein DRO01_07645 [Candidatus Korarchaeota archaeon]